MKKVGDLFQELGFNVSASDDVKIAFIKNLVKAAYGVDVTGPSRPITTHIKKQEVRLQSEPKNLEQLSFDFDVDLKKAN